MKNPREVLKAQVVQVGYRDVLIKQCDSALMTYLMNSKVNTEACCAVESVIKANLCPKVIWMYEEKVQFPSVVGYLQVYSDKSQTFYFASSYAFYPLHIAFLSFTKNIRGKEIVSGSTIVSYLPVVYSHSGAVTVSKKDRVQAVNVLHICVNYVMRPLANIAVEGLLCKTMNKRSLF